MGPGMRWAMGMEFSSWAFRGIQEAALREIGLLVWSHKEGSVSRVGTCKYWFPLWTFGQQMAGAASPA